MSRIPLITRHEDLPAERQHSYDEALPGARPALILFVQTFGDLVNFNPHLHVLASA